MHLVGYEHLLDFFCLSLADDMVTVLPVYGNTVYGIWLPVYGNHYMLPVYG